MDLEEWKDLYVEGEPTDYQISSFGNVKSYRRCKNGKLRKIITDKFGYPAVKIFTDEKRINMKIHRLVYSHFVEDKLFKNLDVSHIDGNKENNKVSNLEAISTKELTRKGRLIKNPEVIKEIKRMRKNKTYKQLSNIYGVSKSTIQNITKYDTHKDLLK